jgi:hypothetical protein
MVIISHTAISSDVNPWLERAYGHDNKHAALKKVEIYKSKKGFKAYIHNQFKFECDLSFSKENVPIKLTNCLSRSKPIPRKGFGSCKRFGIEDLKLCALKCDHCFSQWTVVGGEVNLKCFKTKNEEICRGNYYLTSVPTGSGDPAKMTIARRL